MKLILRIWSFCDDSFVENVTRKVEQCWTIFSIAAACCISPNNWKLRFESYLKEWKEDQMINQIGLMSIWTLNFEYFQTLNMLQLESINIMQVWSKKRIFIQEAPYAEYIKTNVMEEFTRINALNAPLGTSSSPIQIFRNIFFLPKKMHLTFDSNGFFLPFYPSLDILLVFLGDFLLISISFSTKIKRTFLKNSIPSTGFSYACSVNEILLQKQYTKIL